MTIRSDGKVSIGVPDNELLGNYKLYVKEGIITERCRVAFRNTSDWADYVFAKDYCLMPINDLEDFIKENKHLPDVPSADDVVKQGLDVAQTDAMLLKKIEELHLYIIQMKNELDALKAEKTKQQ